MIRESVMEVKCIEPHGNVFVVGNQVHRVVEHTWALVISLLKVNRKHVRDEATFSNAGLAYEEYVGGRYLILKLAERVLQVDGSLDIAWLFNSLEGAFLIPFPVRFRRLIVLDEHERIQRVADVLFDQEILDLRTALEKVVEEQLLRAAILDLVLEFFMLHPIARCHACKVSFCLQDAIHLLTDDFIEPLSFHLLAAVKRDAC